MCYCMLAVIVGYYSTMYTCYNKMCTRSTFEIDDIVIHTVEKLNGVPVGSVGRNKTIFV